VALRERLAARPKAARAARQSVASDGKRLFVAGGRTTDSKGRNRTISRDVWVLDGPADDSWAVLNRLPEERAGRALTWDGQRLVFAGGVNRRDLNGDGKVESINHADVWVWEGEEKWRKIGQLQRKREDLVAASDGNGRAWFLGGADVRGKVSTAALVHPRCGGAVVAVAGCTSPCRSAPGRGRRPLRTTSPGLPNKLGSPAW
jgi:N-acetylneuraminic acid mutarotase